MRRDWLHSLVVPLLLRLPWIVIPAALPFVFRGIAQSQVVLVQAVGALLDFVAMVVVTAMLRFRARSVFNATPGREARVPWGRATARDSRALPALYVTEFARNVLFGLSFSMLFVPFLYLGFKLSLATEAVVLRGVNPVGAFTRSFRLTETRFERWLEMIAMSVFLIVPLWFLMALGFLVVPAAPGARGSRSGSCCPPPSSRSSSTRGRSSTCAWRTARRRGSRKSGTSAELPAPQWQRAAGAAERAPAEARRAGARTSQRRPARSDR